MTETMIDALDSALPYLLLLASACILTGNHLARSFLMACGLAFRARQAAGVAFALAAAAMLVGLTSCHATTALIVFLFALSANAVRLGVLRNAAASALAAFVLIPVVLAS